MTDFDVSEVVELATDLATAEDKVLPQARATVQRGALNIKRDMQADAKGIKHAPHFPAAISYDTKHLAQSIDAEIGPDKDKTQGALGNILYFGGSKSGPVLDINGPLDREAPKFVKAVEGIADGLL